MIYKWYEIWADETHEVPYLLFLFLSVTDKEKFLIIDPLENNRIVDTLPDYESARLWLLEDEFTLVKGRMLFDE